VLRQRAAPVQPGAPARRALRRAQDPSRPCLKNHQSLVLRAETAADKYAWLARLRHASEAAPGAARPPPRSTTEALRAPGLDRPSATPSRASNVRARPSSWPPAPGAQHLISEAVQIGAACGLAPFPASRGLGALRTGGPLASPAALGPRRKRVSGSRQHDPGPQCAFVSGAPRAGDAARGGGGAGRHGQLAGLCGGQPPGPRAAAVEQPGRRAARRRRAQQPGAPHLRLGRECRAGRGERSKSAAACSLFMSAAGACAHMLLPAPCSAQEGLERLRPQ